ncbi:hypothetical protein ACHAXR_006227 [Thalassiosira sp. AJA248-18]
MLTPALSGAKMANAQLRGLQLMRSLSREAFGRHFLLSRPSCRGIGIVRSSSIGSGNNLRASPTGINARNSKDTKQFSPLLQEYEQQVRENRLLFDSMQHHAARKMTRLQTTLKEYDHDVFLQQLKQLEEYENIEQQQKISNEGQKKSPTKELMPPTVSMPIPRGFYIHGNVGTGKSLLLNSFHQSASTLSSSKKRRLHFHSFLQEIHQRIHDQNKQFLQEHGRSFHVDTSKRRNPILRVAEQLSNEVTLLCIDEFQVTDIADAMILSQFFGELWRRGVVVVATSNRPPRDLYEGGLNREYFLPFVDLLEKYCVVHHLGDQRPGSNNEEKDYRRIRSGVDMPGSDKCGDYFYLTREGNEQYTSEKLDKVFRSFQNHSHSFKKIQPLVLQVHFQRTISVSRYHSNVIARFTFDKLCTTELGSSDYHAIANHFQIAIIESIPRLTLKHPDRARRFITLVDELYEAGCCLVCSAADIPDRLFVGKATDDESSHDSKSTSSSGESTETSGNMHAIDVAQVQGTAVSELASVKELSFAFGRAASRLLEMCSKTWWEEKGIKPIVVDKEK